MLLLAAAISIHKQLDIFYVDIVHVYTEHAELGVTSYFVTKLRNILLLK